MSPRERKRWKTVSSAVFFSSKIYSLFLSFYLLKAKAMSTMI